MMNREILLKIESKGQRKGVRGVLICLVCFCFCGGCTLDSIEELFQNLEDNMGIKGSNPATMCAM